MSYLKFLWSLIRHKWYVFVECCKLGVPLLGIIHDCSKFLPSEFIPYAKHFYGKDNKTAFDTAWLHLQRRNRHHWQYWLLQYDQGQVWAAIKDNERDGRFIIENYVETGMDMVVLGDQYLVSHVIDRLNLSPVPLPMPDKYRKEMLADWLGAGRAYGNTDTATWYKERRGKIILHPETRAWIENKLGV